MAPLQEINAYRSARECIKRGRMPVHISGCMTSQKVHFIYGLAQGNPWNVIITQNEIKAREVAEDYRMFDREVLYFPAKDVIFYSADIHGAAITVERLKVVEALLAGRGGTIVTTMDAGMEQLLSLSVYRDAVFTVREGDTLILEGLGGRLVDLGYKREQQAERPGDFSIRGGIIDIFPITSECPYRIELWGDEIDTIRSFDAESQRSIERISELDIFPASEFIVTESEIKKALKEMEKDRKKLSERFQKEKNQEGLSRLTEMLQSVKGDYEGYGDRTRLESFLPYFEVSVGSLFDYFDREETLFFVDEPARCIEKMEAVETEFQESMKGRLEKGYILPGQMEMLYPAETVAALLQGRRTVYLTMLDTLPGQTAAENFHLQVQPVGSYNRHFELLVEDIRKWRRDGYRILLLSGSRTRAGRMSRDLQEYDIPAFYKEKLDVALEPGMVLTSYGFMKQGFAYATAKFIVVTEGDIFGAKVKTKRKKRKQYSGGAIQSFHELNIGDYVVHENHGLGIYRGIEKLQVENTAKDYIKIEYGDGGNLYVPASGLDVLQKYAGRDAKKPKLNKLNTTEWKKTRSKTKAAVEEVAKELVLLYARRQEQEGFCFSKDTVWQNEFEELFPFEETQDQLRAIEETKRDMESPKIMDRLICGDVGYGKTEIAIRAAFKAVNDGKQVAFLVPTTILAQQHYNTIRERLGDFPVTVEMLSRFRTPAQQKKTLELLRKGQLDIVIGTHRLLSADVKFHDLGLLVIDEEQRFGVTHKEKIKQMKGNVDALTLSATPIPRTLHMSLAGIRDMSVLEEPPVDRLPIQTFVMEHNNEIIREAINREIARGGQIYYVYNRVENIEEVAAGVSRLVPEAEIAFAHGRMGERQLENIMMSFIAGDIDVLVATTIIETGLDISNVNTIIIDNADKMGLAQLYQLRGRVGRSNRTAYAFLMYQKNRMLKEEAEKRLAAIREYTELGSGIRIAMRDLEIRGAGNLLGEAQSGHMEAVGYDLYCKMLNEAVRTLKGEKTESEEFETSVDLQVDALIPATYIPSEFQKLDMYKRIAGIENVGEYRDMQEELQDRFGDIPQAAENLLRIALLKASAHHARITQVVQKIDGIRFFLYEKVVVSPVKATELLQNFKGKLKYVQGENPYFLYMIKENKATEVFSVYRFKGKEQPPVKISQADEIFRITENVIRGIGELYD